MFVLRLESHPDGSGRDSRRRTNMGISLKIKAKTYIKIRIEAEAKVLPPAIDSDCKILTLTFYGLRIRLLP
jgi:hypothetical protein